MITRDREPLMQAACQVAEASRRGINWHDAQAYFVTYEDLIAAQIGHESEYGFDLGLEAARIRMAEQVADPERKAVDDQQGTWRRGALQGIGKQQWFLY
jgi:hypothetical protein